MSKDDIKIFTGSGVLDLTKRKTEKPTDKPQYISASGGNESIVHENCGTDDCCNECTPSSATREKLN